MLLVPTLLPVDQFSHSHPQRTLLYYQLRNEFSARNTKEARAAEKCSHFTPLLLASPGGNIRGSQSSGVAISKWGTPRILRSAPSNSLGKARYAPPVHLRFISNYLNNPLSLFSAQYFSSPKMFFMCNWKELSTLSNPTLNPQHPKSFCFFTQPNETASQQALGSASTLQQKSTHQHIADRVSLTQLMSESTHIPRGPCSNLEVAVTGVQFIRGPIKIACTVFGIVQIRPRWCSCSCITMTGEGKNEMLVLISHFKLLHGAEMFKFA